MHHIGATQLESIFAEKELQVLVDTKLKRNQQCALITKKVNSTPGCIRQSTASRSMGGDPLFSAVEAIPRVLCPVLGSPVQET